ncbi:NtaA/DmoA family FMN-dependent monooxygenase [Streptomyces sp. NPDC008139]|uniref:NtaA/DmoA family FMN-dependent monooxygenase n=1 Tax=Streptomyces sp. NPDC008139 TaxID=3364814 RepID=UPI0036EDE608
MLLLRPGGYHRASWRMPDSPAERAADLEVYVEMARAAERAKFDAVFMADSPMLLSDPWDYLAQPLEPLTLLSAVAALTERIGLLATVSTTYYEPLNLARLLASLDRISKGRAGWNVVTTADPRAPRLFGGTTQVDHALRYRRAAEFVETVCELWDGWEDGAVVVDRAAGVLTDPGKIHRIEHHGRFFDVSGPFNIPRSVQGRPVLAHAGQSPDGLSVAPHYAEVLFGVAHDLADAQRVYADVKTRVRSVGRDPDHLSVLPGLLPVIGSTDEEARRLDEELRQLGQADTIADDLAHQLGLDPASIDPAAPIDVAAVNHPDTLNGPQSWYRQIYADVERGASFADLVAKYSRIGRSGHLQVIGSPETVADVLEEWFTARGCDGFVVQGTTVPGSTDAFMEHVVPLLRRRGLFRTEYEGSTLRDHLGLPRPVNRFADAPNPVTHESAFQPSAPPRQAAR